jgi:hypothetical protein
LEQAQAAATAAADGHEKLIGLPDSPIKLGSEWYVPGPIGRIQDTAEKYMKSAGLPYNPGRNYIKVDPVHATRIANAFEQMRHDPDDPKVKASYAALAAETLAQWHAIKDTGFKVEWIKPGQADPYADSPRRAAMDVSLNNHLWGFPTDAGFGSGTPEAEEAKKNNPMLAMTDEVIDGHHCVVNDIFRIVHDYFGHFKNGVGFRADGEDNAWRSHVTMYSDAAKGAMTIGDARTKFVGEFRSLRREQQNRERRRHSLSPRRRSGCCRSGHGIQIPARKSPPASSRRASRPPTR